MYETDREMGLGFDRETRDRMRAVFAGQMCRLCGAPAERLSADLFYCGFHFPSRRASETSPPRVYACAVAQTE
jgi:hypothetical protein